MTLLLNCQSLSKSYSPRTLFQGLSLSIFSKDRIGLIGPNGSGKSTLLNILAGREPPDEGIVSPKRDLRIGYVPQACEFPDLSPQEILERAADPSLPDYERERLAEMWLSKLGFTGSEPLTSKLSGGWKKRLGFACELIRSPDLLLLDEPTNHLDLEGILWLETYLQREAPPYLLVSHDRYFLQHVANRIIEIDSIYPGGQFSVDGSYAEFLARKEEFLAGQIQQERSVASKARRELDWLRQGAKARTTKAQSRINEAEALFEQHAELKARTLSKRAAINFAASERETRKLLSAKNLTKSIEGRLLFSRLDFVLSPGTRIGLMGPNGSGKTTLLKLLAGELEPDAGTLKRADELKIVYFDQHRAELPQNITLREALSPKGDYVSFRGQSIHVNGWCKRFLFSPDLLERKLSTLSGGERARISIAHLMLQPADLLLLDEPTNDLDIPTLETLEESLQEFPGAVVLITHDRCMLDRICNLFIALGHPEQVGLYNDYAQWLQTQEKRVETVQKKKEAAPAARAEKLSYSERKEYEALEGRIEKMEQDLHALNGLLDKAEQGELSKICQEIGLMQTKIEALYLRWEELGRKQ